MQNAWSRRASRDEVAQVSPLASPAAPTPASLAGIRQESENPAFRRTASATTPPATLAQLTLTSPSQNDIWSPMYSGTSAGASGGISSGGIPGGISSGGLPGGLAGSGIAGGLGGLRGASFGAYGASSSLRSVSTRASSSSIDSERYHTGGMAWGSAELPHRRLVSVPTEFGAARPLDGRPLDGRPLDGRGLDGRRPSAEQHAPFISALHPKEPSQSLDFTVPAVSILERFSNLGDATLRAEMTAHGEPEPRTPQASPSMAHPEPRSSVPVPVPSLSAVPQLADTAVFGASKRSGSAGSAGSAASAGSAGSLGSAGSGTSAASVGSSGSASSLGVPGTVPTAPSSAPGTSGSAGSARRKKTSPILERLRGEHPALEDLLGGVVEASSDQHGSRFIQERLPSSTAATKRAVVAEVVPSILSLSTDVFGNYVVQLLFQVSSAADRHRMFEPLATHILSLSLHMYGCRVVQVALKQLKLADQRVIVSELKGSVAQCIRDHNGNHVLQKAIECMPSEDLGFVYDLLLKDTLSYSTHMYGCRVVQRALEHGSPPIQRQLMATIGSQIEMLVVDQYGNYVVQHVVENGPPADSEMVFGKLLPHIVRLSEHKYASNVVERCFIRGSPRQRKAMVDTIVTEQYNGKPAVVAMMKDQYANYVIQRILGTSKDENYEKLARVVKQNLPLVKKNHHGKHLQAIERRLK